MSVPSTSSIAQSLVTIQLDLSTNVLPEAQAPSIQPSMLRWLILCLFYTKETHHLDYVSYSPRLPLMTPLPLPTGRIWLGVTSLGLLKKSWALVTSGSSGKVVGKWPQRSHFSETGPPLTRARPWEGPLLSTQLCSLPHQPASCCMEQPHSCTTEVRSEPGREQGDGEMQLPEKYESSLYFENAIKNSLKCH